MLAVIPVLHAALKLRRIHLWVAVIGYLSVTIFAFVAMPSPEVRGATVMDDLATAATLVLMVGGTAHAFMLRLQVFGRVQRRNKIETLAGVRWSTWSTFISICWALVPLVSVGSLAVIPALHAALKLRRIHLWLSVVAYVGATLFVFVAIPSAGEDPTVIGDLAVAVVTVLIAVGTAHAFMLRPHVFEGASRPDSFISDATAAQESRPQLQVHIVDDTTVDHNVQRPRSHSAIVSGSVAGQPKSLSRYEILVLVVTVVVGLLSAASTIIAQAFF